MLTSITCHTASSSSLRRWVVLMAATLLALVLAAPAARADTNTDMTQALASVDGKKGWMVKRLSGATGGVTVAAKNPSVVFEPASTIKFLHHLTATIRIQADETLKNALTQPWYTPATDSCPQIDSSPGIFFGDPLQDAMSKMMWASDNGRTEAVNQFLGGYAELNETAQTLNATNTLVQHRLGCGAQALAKPNKLTLSDASKLYRAAFTGDLLQPESRQFMWERMPSQHPQFTKAAQKVAQQTFGKPTPAAFTAALKSAYKAGGYRLCTASGCKAYVSVAGYVEIPWKSIYGLAVPRRYTFGLFMHGTTASDQTIASASNKAMRALLREEIKNALDSWL